MTSKRDVRVRRAYDEPTGEDGARVLVDRIWPRGLSKEKASLEEWCKAVAPFNGAAHVVWPRPGAL